jgi:hypothetical protein
MASPIFDMSDLHFLKGTELHYPILSTMFTKHRARPHGSEGKPEQTGGAFGQPPCLLSESAPPSDA